MRISLLQKRENFNQVFCDTVAEYWSRNSNIRVEITTSKKLDTPLYNNLYANKYFNFIARKNTPPKAFEALEKEYSHSNSYAKKKLLNTYFNCSIHPLILPFLSHQKYYVYPRIPEKKSFVIFGGNTRLRIVYPDRDQTVVLLKKGFDRSYIKNEILYRSTTNLKIAPQWHNHDLENGFFTEAYNPGQPINRLSGSDYRAELQQKAMIELLKEVILPSTSSREVNDYFKEKIIAISKYQALINEGSINNKISEIVSIIKKLIKSISGKIQTAYSHGDFQQANIILTDEGLKVIDWETIGRRSVTYDFFTVYLEARSGMKRKILWDETDSFYSKIKRELKDKMNIDFDTDRIRYLSIYFLEELDYLLKSSCSPAFYKNGIGLYSKLSILRSKLEEVFE